MDDLACANWTFVLIVSSVSVLITIATLLLASLVVYKCKQKSRSLASPCFHIKDDTMIYSRAGFEPGTAVMNYHHNPLDTESNTYAKASILQGGYSPPSTEPLYEVPKYSNTQELVEEHPKSSSTTGSSKYSSSGYIGSELWESDFLGHTGTGNPIVMNFGTQRSPRSSSGLGSTNSSTGSGGTGTTHKPVPVFYSPARSLAGAPLHNLSGTPIHGGHGTGVLGTVGHGSGGKGTLINGSHTNSPAKYSMFMVTNTNNHKYPIQQQHHLVSGTSIRSPRSRPIHNAYV